jgi:acyl-CoA dehydrogenase
VSSPFLEPRHRDLAQRVRAFGEAHLRSGAEDEADLVGRTRELALRLSDAGFLNYAVPPPAGSMDLRGLVLVRENLAYFSSLADSTFAMQGLGSHAVSLAGSEIQKKRWLSAITHGEILAAFAVTEPDAGSDLAAVRTQAEKDGGLWRLTGVKTLISNAGIAGMYTVLARSDKRDGEDALSMFLVDAQSPGISVKPLQLMAPHPIGELRFQGTPALLLGEQGKGYALALQTLDTFRASVAAAALGMAQRAFDEAVRHALGRRQFGRPLSEFQGVQMAIAEMHAELQAARLLVYQAAYARDQGQERITLEGSTAKLFATEMAQRVVDRALQLHGGQGVLKGATVERLYREVRALRIYEGASEIQKLVIARQIFKEKK